MADGWIHIEAGEEIHDSLLAGGRGQRLMERWDIEVAPEGQWGVPGEPQGPTQSPRRPFKAP